MANEWDVIIVGAGAAGLMCAATAGQRGQSVLVLDSGKKPGRKILISGGGRCNFTNYDVSANHYVCQNPHFVKSALSQYSQWDFLGLIGKHEVAFEERDHGQLFCLESAKDIVTLLLSECDLPNIQQRYQVAISAVEKTDSGFSVRLGDEILSCVSLVIATGGLSMPKLGATPLGYRLAEQFGLNVIPTSAGLVPFTLHTEDKDRWSPLSGVAVPCRVETESGVSFRENILFTHRGLSGPAVLQISSYWKSGQAVFIDWLPDGDWRELLDECRQQQPNLTLKNALSRTLPKRVVESFMAHQGWADKPLKQWDHKDWNHLIEMLHHYPIKPNGTEGYRTAEVTLGGVDTNDLSSKTMEAKNIKGLFFVGEVMDVSGWLGGYNFQWAWSSGYVAGLNV
jgi:hypothetical protein